MKKKNQVVVAAKVPRNETTALTVHLSEIVFPEGVETLGEKANFLHGYSVEASKRANGAAPSHSAVMPSASYATMPNSNS